MLIQMKLVDVMMRFMCCKTARLTMAVIQHGVHPIWPHMHFIRLQALTLNFLC